MRPYRLIVIINSLLVHTIHVVAQQEIDVKMKLSKRTILLGEPVWILLTARNVSKTTLKVDPGDYCFKDGQVPVVAVVPDAVSGNGKA